MHACSWPVQLLVMLQVGWYGSKELAGFRAAANPLQQLRTACGARGHATVNAPTLRRLREAAKSGALLLLEGCNVVAAQRSGSCWNVDLDAAVPAGREAGQAAQGSTGAVTACQPDQVSGFSNQLQAEILWVAAGSVGDVLADLVLAQLQGSCPTHIAGGCPVLDDATLAWPGLPLFLLGRAALLSLGPAAGSGAHPPPQLEASATLHAPAMLPQFCRGIGPIVAASMDMRSCLRRRHARHAHGGGAHLEVRGRHLQRLRPAGGCALGIPGCAPGRPQGSRGCRGPG